MGGAKATPSGRLPTVIVEATVAVAVSSTVTVPALPSVTYARVPEGWKATASGPAPAGTEAVVAPVAASTTETLLPS